MDLRLGILLEDGEEMKGGEAERARRGLKNAGSTQVLNTSEKE